MSSSITCNWNGLGESRSTHIKAIKCKNIVKKVTNYFGNNIIYIQHNLKSSKIQLLYYCIFRLSQIFFNSFSPKNKDENQLFISKSYSTYDFLVTKCNK